MRCLADILSDLATEYEIPFVPLHGNDMMKLNINHDGKSVNMIYEFHKSQDRYYFGAVLGRGGNFEGRDFLTKLMASNAIVGLTERIIDRKFTLLGGRDHLTNQPDNIIRTGFMEDISRIKRYIESHKHLWL